MEDLRSLIREILKEELSNLKDKINGENISIKEEGVKIESSADLNNFVKRIITMFQDAKLKSDIITGKHIFRLVNQEKPSHIKAHEPISRMPTNSQTIAFEGGIVTLRDVETLANKTKSLTVGKSTHCTPLALDEIRKRKIKLEREIK